MNNNYNVNFKEKALEYKEQMLEDLCGLLKINSVLDETTSSEGAPFGKGIKEALDYFLKIAKRDGFKTYCDAGYAGVLTYGEKEDAIGILCHLDVVPTGGNWKFPPFSATIEDGKIYARGSMDDKGPTMAAYYALKMIKDLGIVLKKRVEIILGTDEETAWRGINHYALNHKMPEIGFAPDADFPLIYGEKGILNAYLKSNYQDDDLVSFKGGERFNVVIDEAEAITKMNHQKEFVQFLKEYDLDGKTALLENGNVSYKVYGKAAHAMEPMKGVNAGTYLLKFLSGFVNHPLVKFVSENIHNDFYLNKLGLNVTHPEMHELTCNMGIIDYENGQMKASLDIRYPIGFSLEHFEKTLKEKLPKECSYEITQNKTPLYVSKNDELVQDLYESYKKYSGDMINDPKTIGGGTYARALKKGVAFGMEAPNAPSVAHQPNEYVVIDDLLTAIVIYADAITKIGNK